MMFRHPQVLLLQRLLRTRKIARDGEAITCRAFGALKERNKSPQVIIRRIYFAALRLRILLVSSWADGPGYYIPRRGR